MAGSKARERQVERSRGHEGPSVCDLVEHAIDVDAAVGRPVPREPPGGLLELSLAAGPVATGRVMPRHGDVDEPLEEVALGLRGVAPLVLELLVGLEKRSRADELEPLLQPHTGKYPRPPTARPVRKHERSGREAAVFRDFPRPASARADSGLAEC
jgi:hypothetical protein